MKYRYLFFLLLFISAIDSASATVRRVYFSQYGNNRTALGLATAISTYCTITIVNRSTVNQTYDLTVTAVAGGTTTGVGPASCTSPAGCNYPAANSGTLTPGQAQAYTFTYPAFPALTVGNQSQTLTCSGSVQATDATPAAPGFLFANGNITTFIESGAATNALTVGTAHVQGNAAVYTLVPIAINRGKAF